MNQDDNGITKLGCVNHDCDKCKAQQQEPVAWLRHDRDHVVLAKNLTAHPEYERRFPIPLYTSPPASKPWAELSVDEMVALVKKYRDAPVALVAAIETKLREKNT